MRAELREGSELAGYRIEALLGRGGMGVVYLAEHLGLKRKVALKILPPELAEDDRFRERFVRESRLAASLEHPNIVPIHEAGEADGLLFIAMRYVRGTDLRQVIDEEGRLDPERAVEIVRQVAGALDAAHAEGLVHRDVKPGNILVAPGQAAPELVYLSDFGLTKHALSDSGITGTGQFMGTIDYAAPEQFEDKPLDGRTDQYSLGCVLYESLTGEVPYRKDQEAAVMYAHLREPPPRVTAVRPELPPGLDRVVARALAKRPADRYPTCGELAAAARAELGPPSSERTVRAGLIPALVPRRSRRLLVGIGGIFVAAVAIAVGLLLTRGGGETRPESSPTAATGTSAPTTIVASEFTADLLVHIPADIRSSCEPATPLSPEALAGVSCTSEETEVQYSLYESRPDMDAAYDRSLLVQGAEGGDCSVDHDAEHP